MELITSNEINNRIFTIRDQQVMLDTHLAEFYQVKPIRLREQVKRNLNRFPLDFMFQLTEHEVDFMVSQNAIPSKQHLGGSLPYAFTEQGVAAVSAVLKSEQAVLMSIQIIRTFVEMRKTLATNNLIDLRFKNIEKRLIETDQKFEQVFKALENKNTLNSQQGIFFEGQIFDAYAFVSEIIRKANSSIILIDNYIDESVLTLLSKRRENVRTIIFTKQISRQLQLDIDRYNAQYPAVEINILTDSHDRFLLIDQTELYHIGASLKDLGKKWFAFSKMNDFTKDILKRINL